MMCHRHALLETLFHTGWPEGERLGLCRLDQSTQATRRILGFLKPARLVHDIREFTAKLNYKASKKLSAKSFSTSVLTPP